VQDWLYHYVYLDAMYMTENNKLVSAGAVFLASGIVHEYVISFFFNFFYPALIVVFVGIGRKYAVTCLYSTFGSWQSQYSVVCCPIIVHPSPFASYTYIPGTLFWRYISYAETSIMCLYSVRGLERSELDGSHGCPGSFWDRF